MGVDRYVELSTEPPVARNSLFLPITVLCGKFSGYGLTVLLEDGTVPACVSNLNMCVCTCGCEREVSRVFSGGRRRLPAT